MMSRSAILIVSMFFWFAGPSLAKGQMDDMPIGSVVAWLKSVPGTPALPAGWVECNGQVLSDIGSIYNGQAIPNLNGTGGGVPRFLRGAATSGAAGGNENHAHVIQAPNNANCSGECGSGCCSWSAGPSSITSESSPTLPSYYEVVWILKVKASSGTVPAISDWGMIVMTLLVVAAGSIALLRRRSSVPIT